MNKAELVKIIYETVKHAVRAEMKSVKAEIISEIKKSKTSIIKETNHDDIDSIVDNMLSADRQKSKQKTTSKKLSLSSNPMLNDLLNETYASTTQDREEWPTIKATTSAKSFDRASMAAALGYGNMDNGQVSAQSMLPNTTTEGGTMHVDAEELPDHVTNALTRDYRELVKKFKK